MLLTSLEAEKIKIRVSFYFSGDVMSLMDLGMIKTQEFASLKQLQKRHKSTSEGTPRGCFPYSTM